ncbi:MAG: MATE family efflux transporter [Clostridia bacterium]|nr:MATE family efflux transporter [Clostridia bacterium]
MKNLFAPTDMTVGKPWKAIISFSIPMLIGNIAQQLYSTVDSIVVGHYVGDNALASVGSVLPILNMLLVLFIGISAGASIMVAQYFGAKNREKLSITIGNCITVTAIVSIVLMFAAPPFVRNILELLNTPASIIDGCEDYLVISMVGIAGMAYYNILSGIIRGMGDSVSALVYLIIATILNIFLDIWFVASFKMGVAGVALATIISQFVSSALCLIKLARMNEYFTLDFSTLKLKKDCIKTLVKLGLPSGLTQAIMSSAMIVVQALTNQFGEQFIAANIIVMRVDGFAMMPNLSFGTAMTTYAGQNIGAKKFDRISVGAKQGLLISVICSTLITGIILLFGKYLMMAFTETASLVDLSVHLMRILAAGYIAMAVTQSLGGVMRGAGDTVTPMWITLITTIFMRIPLAYGISYLTRSPEFPLGYKECIQISLLITWIMGAALTTAFYLKGNWKKKSIN